MTKSSAWIRRIGSMLATAGILAAAAPLAMPGHVAAALAAPSLTAPTSGATVNGNPTFAWTSVASAVTYRIEISASASFSSPVVSDDTANLRYAPASELPLGQLYWRVAARDVSNALGSWASDTFTKQWASAPALENPSDGAALNFPGDPLQFSWDAMPGAQSYELQLDDAADFIGATTFTTKSTSYVVTEPRTPGQVFFWRVRAVGSGGLYSAYSQTRSVTAQWPSVPGLVAPADGATLADVSLSWNPVPGAKTYQIQVSPNSDFSNNVIIDTVIKGTIFAPPNELNNGNYFWRVRAKDSSGAQNNGTWSATRQFQRAYVDHQNSPVLERPILVGPVDGNYALSQLVFSWQPIEHAAFYNLEWSTDPNFFPPASHECYTNHTQVSPYDPIVAGGEPGGCDLDIPSGATIYWHVRGIDPPNLNPGAGEPGILGVWSNSSNLDVWTFVYQPSVPTQVAPANGSTISVPTFSWSDVPGATHYKLTVVDKNLSTVLQADTFSTSYTPTSALDTSKSPFKWYVQEYDTNGILSLIPPQVAWWSFTLVAIPTTYALPEQTAPADGSTSVDMPSLAWQPVTGATHYRVWYSTNNVAYAQLINSTVYPAYTYPSSVMASGKYWWYVEAYDNSNVLISTSTLPSTYLIGAPDLIDPTGYIAPARCTLPCTPVEDTPTLSWTPVTGAISYRVYIATDPNFTNIYRTYDTNYTQITPRESFLDNQAGQALYWFVRPIRSNNTGRFDSQAQSNASAFQKRSEAIALLGPDNAGSVANLITFSWEDFLATNQNLDVPVDQEAKQYHFQASVVADFSSVFDNQTVDQPFYTPSSSTYAEGPIYWRVQAIDNSGNGLTWSATRLVTKASPKIVMVSPANGAAVGAVPNLSWQPQNYAASYNVQLATDVNFTNRIADVTTAMSSWTYTDALSAGVTYYWRVRRNDADNRAGPWSDTRTFTVQPTQPTLVTPGNGSSASPTSLVLSWTAATPSPSYRVELSTSPTFASQLSGYPQDTVMSSWAPKILLGDGTYYWRVSARNANGQVIATSTTFNFLVDATRPSVTALSPSSGAALNAAFTVTFSRAVTGVDGTTFVVTLAGTATPVSGTVNTPTSTTATFTPDARLMPGQTYTFSLSTGITSLGGNPLLPYSANVRAATTLQENSVAATEAWARWTTASASGGSMLMSRKVSSKLTYSFTGTSIGLVGYTGTTGGYATITLDGVTQTSTANFYASSAHYKAVIWSKAGLAAGNHTLVVLPRGTKPTASKDTWVYVDAFNTDGGPVESASASVLAGFRHIATSSAYGGAYDVMDFVAASGRAAPSYTVQFKGTAVTWYGTKGTTYGKAYVYIDGVKKATIDLYRSSTAYKQKLFASATLTNSVHTLRIVLVGSKNTLSKGYDVSVDELVIK